MIIISSTLGLGYRLTSGLRSVLPQIQSFAEFYTEICCYHYKILYLILVVRPIYPILICLSISWHSNFIGYTVQHLGVFSCYTSHSICDAYIAVAVHFGFCDLCHETMHKNWMIFIVKQRFILKRRKYFQRNTLHNTS